MSNASHAELIFYSVLVVYCGGKFDWSFVRFRSHIIYNYVLIFNFPFTYRLSHLLYKLFHAILSKLQVVFELFSRFLPSAVTPLLCAFSLLYTR